MASRTKSTKRAATSKRLTRKEARTAAEKAREHFATHPITGRQAWQKGGREWDRILGHFGPSK